MKYLYACYGKAGIDCLYQLLNQGECREKDILAITYKDAPNRELIEHFKALKIPYITEAIKDKKVGSLIGDFSPDYLFSIYFRDIIKKEVLDLVKKAAVNLHPSLLPDYKGCFSAPWVLINGERKTGITYHMIYTGVDTGNIVLQKELEISEADTAFSLYHRLVALGTESFSEMFRLVLREGCRGKPQEPGGRIYKRGLPYGGHFSLDWERKRIHNFIRAMYFPPHAGAKLRYDGKEFEFKTPEEFDDFCVKHGIDTK